MNIFDFTIKGEKTFRKLPENMQSRILNKLLLIKGHPDIFSMLSTIENYPPSTHRLRVGSYRLLLGLIDQDKSDNTFLVLKVGHRKEIYR